TVKGSVLTGLFLYCLFLLPGLIYSIWRQSTAAQVCRNCGSPAVIPLGSPAAQQVLANRGVGSGQIQAAAPHSGVAARDVARRTSTSKIAVGIVAGCFLIVIIDIAMNTGAPTNAARQKTSGPSASPATPQADQVKIAKLTPAEQKQAKEQALFQQRLPAARVVAIQAIPELRSMMRNPDSFKLTWISIMPSYAVCYEFRSQNGFGGMDNGGAVLAPRTMQLQVVSFDDSDGNLVSASNALNKYCANKSGYDIDPDAAAMALHMAGEQ
ncbi:MAG: hypothetical protein ACRD3S_06090, partial [Terracidiphilus sp.]